MKKLLLNNLLAWICIFFCFFKTAFAQKEFNNWYYGTFAGMTFNSGAPVNLTNGALSTTEGCSTISDSAGNLLFYTEGVNVYNSNHVLMPNGTGLFGGISASESAIIVPDPASPTKYYIFTVDQAGGFNGFRYSKVDMTLQGGLGDVTTKNIALLGQTDEKLCATKQATGNGYWVLVHGLSSSSSSYYAYPVTSSGVGLPTISPVSALNTAINPWTGYIKFSADGTKLANALYAMYGVEIADFNDTTGAVSNPFIYYPGSGNYMYGVEFSETGNFLYCGNVDYTPGRVFQLNMRAGNSAAILASAIVIHNSNWRSGALQMAPDHKMYMAHPAAYYLGVINNPDSLGPLCNYSDSGFASVNQVLIGLPNFVTGRSASLPPTAVFSSSDTTFCNEGGKCISFFDHSVNGPTSWQWIFNGASPDTSTQQNPTNICYFYPGTYTVTLIVTNANGVDTLTVAPMITVGNAPLPPTITIIGGDTLVCSPAASYQWFYNGSPIGGAIDSFYVAVQGGTYSVQIADGLGCSSLSGGVFMTGISLTANLVITIYPNPAREELIIDSKLAGVKTATVYNLVGETVMEQKIDSEDSVLNIKELSAGLYFIRISSKEENDVMKFIKE